MFLQENLKIVTFYFTFFWGGEGGRRRRKFTLLVGLELRHNVGRQARRRIGSRARRWLSGCTMLHFLRPPRPSLDPQHVERDGPGRGTVCPRREDVIGCAVCALERDGRPCTRPGTPRPRREGLGPLRAAAIRSRPARAPGPRGDASVRESERQRE